MARRCILLLIAVLALLAASTTALVQRKMPKFTYHRDDNPMNVPLLFNIFLVGFDGTGANGFALPAAKLEQFMFDLFPEHHPVCQDSGEKLHVSFEIWYNVVAVHTSYLEKGHLALKQALKETGETVILQTNPEEVTELPVYEVAVDGAIHDYFQSVFNEHTRTARYKTSDSERSFGLFIINPDKTAFAPGGVAHKPFVYRYRTSGDTMGSTFVSRTRYAVLDLSAGPSQLGQTAAAEGTVVFKTFPNTKDYMLTDGSTKSQEVLQNTFMAQLSKHIISSIRYIFAPDVRFDALDYSEKVLIPLLVFRNHMRFDPLEPGHTYSINTTRILEAVKHLTLPGQEVELIYGVHSLADHERVSMAVERAAKSNTVHRAKAGKFVVTASHYLDSELLMHDLAMTSDYLASGLLSSSHTLKKAFFPDDMEKTQGTRVLPVMVFSLIDDGEPLLFDRSTLFAASKDMVLVLQNNVDDLEMPFFTDRTNIEVSAVDATPHIIAGLAEAMSGVVAPYSRRSRLHNREVVDYTWALGFHPFGPFSNGTELSQLHADLALRNSIISRCDAALSKIQDAMTMLHKFSSLYLVDPWGTEVHSKPPQQSRIVEYFYEHKESVGALGMSTVSRLRDDLARMQGVFEETAEVLYLLDLVKGHTLSDRAFRMASDFHKFVLRELESTEEALFCCNVDHSVVSRTDWALILRSAIGWLFAAAIVFLVLGYTPANPASLARRLHQKKVKLNVM